MAEREAYLHMWAIVPPPEVAQKIDAVRKEFSENFNCFKALRPPVHITLYKPFSLPIAEVETQIGKLRRWISTQPSFHVEVKNFSFFDNRRNPVVFIDVIPNPDLKALNSGLTHETKVLFELDDLSRPEFHPHFTIGYRDVPKDIFQEVRKAYSRRPFSAAFEAKHVSLFRHNGKKWQLQHELPLAVKDNGQGSLW